VSDKTFVNKSGGNRMSSKILVLAQDETILKPIATRLERDGYLVVTGKGSVDEFERLKSRVDWIESHVEDATWFTATSESMAQVHEQLTRLRRDSMHLDIEESNVLLVGQPGCGRHSLARTIHSLSRRARSPWVVCNCTTRQNGNSELLEIEIFGCEKGAFPGYAELSHGVLDLAYGGTLYLAGVEYLPPTLQTKLADAIRTKTFRQMGGKKDLRLHVRIIASVTEPEKLNPDLHRLLSSSVIDIPTLRDRKSDIIPLAHHIGEWAFRSQGKNFPGFSAMTEEMLASYAWPGNVQELRLVVERLALVCDGLVPIMPRYLGIPVPVTASGSPKLELLPPVSEASNVDATQVAGYQDIKKRWSASFDKEFLISTLVRNAGNVSAAAREAKIDRSNFLRLLRKYGIRSQDYRKAA